MTRSMGSHHSARPMTTTWLTPPRVIDALGGQESFDLDPCAVFRSPIPTARRCLPHVFYDGLVEPWHGRVWLNPPYTSGEIGVWLGRLADHGRGTALIFARTETREFRAQVWERASGALFLYGRLHFHYPDGARAAANAGAPSVLVAYGQDDLDRLAASGLEGALTPLRFTRFVAVQMLDEVLPTWRELVAEHVANSTVSVSDIYRAVARHPKANRNPHWRAKVRQTLQRGGFTRVSRGQWRKVA